MKIVRWIGDRWAELIMIIATILLVSGVVTLGSSFSMEAKVKSGEMNLRCMFESGEWYIPADEIYGYNSSTGYWSFKNGYAKNCRVYK